MINRLTATVAVSAVIAVGSLQAAEADSNRIDVASLGPQVGEQVPDFRLQDQNGEFHTLESVMGPNGAMLLFHRSADW